MDGRFGDLALRNTYETFKADKPIKGYLFIIAVGILGALAGFSIGMSKQEQLLNLIFFTLIGWIIGIIITALRIWSYPK